ncbi:MAG: filamentous hemagglutinin N-terminal domain-containing protein, partial [Roseobacter sp.]|nr:filamentous hemagglutinin N-terminal domain-containing protein [Roseobacter sp.]
MKSTGLITRLSRFAHQAVTALSIVALTAQPILAQSLPIVADPNAQGGLGVQTAPNGVPLVDIATPNAQGLSHNTYDQFNVGAPGAILNNETGTFGTTQLGGVVQGNPNLAQSGAARVILNEVVSANRSELAGIVEVAGQAADVIIANPNGITCNGCGFIRTPRVTLTTGAPEIAGGVLTGFRVDGGDVLIGANGADLGSVSLFDIVSRQVRFEGAVQGGDAVRLSVGPNRFTY